MKDVKRFLSLVLCGAMLLSNFPAVSFAAEEDGLCEHHTVHIDCGYVAAVEAVECDHTHDEFCGYAPGEEEIPCDCGQEEHSEDCSYIPAVLGAPCTHEHGDCSYVEAVEAQPCDFECEDCLAKEETSGGSIYIGGVELSDGYYLANDSSEVSAAAPESGGYAYFKDGTLTLNNYIYEGAGYTYSYNNSNASSSIFVDSSLTIELIGDNVIKNVVENFSYHHYYYCYGINIRENLTITGDNDASLTTMGGVATDSYGIYAEGDIVITGGKVTAISSGNWEEDEYCASSLGICAANVTITSGEVIATSGDADYGCGIAAEGNITVKDGRVTATGSEVGDDGYGIAAGDNVTIEDGTVTAEGGSYGISANNVTVEGGTVSSAGGERLRSYGIAASDNVTIEGGTVTAIGGDAGIESIGIYAYEVTIAGGEVTASGDTTTYTDESYGICAYCVTVEDGSVSATGGEADKNSYGIYTDEFSTAAKVTVNGGTVTAMGGMATSSYGILTPIVAIDDGTAIVSSSGAEVYSYGIYARKYITVNGGAVTTTGGASEYSYGIAAEGNITVSCGELIATGGTATTCSYGIWGDLDIIVEDSSVIATGGATTSKHGESYGIYAGGEGANFRSNITIKSGMVTAIGGNAEWESCGIYAVGDLTISGGTLTIIGDDLSHVSGKVVVENPLRVTAAVSVMDPIEPYVPERLGTYKLIRIEVVNGCTTEGHTWTAASCTDPKTCDICGATEGEALGHKEVTDKAVEATCTETGLTEGKHCSMCETILVVQEEIPALGHSYSDGICTKCGDIDVSNILASGTYGTNLSWILEADGTLTISGNGAMTNYSSDNRPWQDYLKKIYNVVIESGVTSIGIYAFYDCTELRTVSIPDSIQDIGIYAFYGCIKLDNVSVPAGVPEIEGATFYGCSSLSNIILPDGITSIGNTAFKGCNSLVNITLPDSVAIIENSAFSGCVNLVSINLPDRMTTIGKYVFEYCKSLTGITIPDGVTAIEFRTFAGCSSLTYITLPEGLTSIASSAFNSCSSLVDITLPESLTSIASSAFSGCSSLTGIVLPEGITSIDSQAFYDCVSLETVVIPKSATSIGSSVFANCENLSSVTLPQNIKEIGERAFYNCDTLTEITIPASVNTIWQYAFSSCNNLTKITFEGKVPYIYENAFYKVVAEAWYPLDDLSWTDDVKQDYGGTITWIPYSEVENRLILDSEALSGKDSVWIDGAEKVIQKNGDSWYIDLTDSNAHVMTTYIYHVDDSAEDGVDTHRRYPVSMQVWTLENRNGVYSATWQQDFDDILQYSGTSIRVTGKKGIRMITSIDKNKRDALTGDGLAGYTVKEYGTAIAWARQLSDTKPLVLGNSYVKSNYAYKKGMADAVFAHTGDQMQYTNVLINFSLDQCKNDIAMRPYMILADAEGNEITIYGGIVYRSIGYIALRNRFRYPNYSDYYDYVWEIIHAVYGDAYDADWHPEWSDSIM